MWQFTLSMWQLGLEVGIQGDLVETRDGLVGIRTLFVEIHHSRQTFSSNS